ncbi:hypothetical protein LJC33_02365 [Eubacteriales bacterium OttesenSCG-928-N13]|nr:hypothetical protein [Eubacteriales bacterium OttesenSCG-928-N13]
MGDKIIVCGLNGAGKSTFGRSFAQALGWTFADIEDYYFPNVDAEYKFSVSRTKQEVCDMLLADMRANDNFILAAVKGDYGQDVMSMFTRAIQICVPKDIRMKRVRDRSHQKFGDRMLPGGDLHDQEEAFFAFVDARSEDEVHQWLAQASIPIIQLDGLNTIEENIRLVKAELMDCQ